MNRRELDEEIVDKKEGEEIHLFNESGIALLVNNFSIVLC